MKKIIVSGATGNIGIPVLNYLLKMNAEPNIVAGVHNTRQALKVFSASPQVEIRKLDFEDPDTFAPALKDCDVLFLLRPPQISDAKKFRPLLQQAKESGLRGIVFLSVQGADKLRFIPHAKIEKLIHESGIPYVFLRPGYFMQNFTTTLAEDVRHGTILLPAGNAPFMWTDADNIGEVAAHILLHFDKFTNTAFDITGKEAVSFGEAVKRINEATGSRLKYQSVNLIRFWLHRKKLGTPPAMIVVMIMLHLSLPGRKPGNLSAVYQNITGKEPATLAEFAKREMRTHN
jgi:Predicted nucleoside-diphosphate-sugar epimerases